jgi:hypothetical protein
LKHGTSLLSQNGASEKEWGRTGKRRGRLAELPGPDSSCLFAADDYAKRSVQVNTLLYAEADAAARTPGGA